MAESNLPLVKFTGSNYQAWKKSVNLIFTVLELTGIVDGTVPKPDPSKTADLAEWIKKDAKAQNLIYYSVDKGSQYLLENVDSSKKMMEQLQKAYDDKSIVSQVETQRQMMNFKFDERESFIEQYFNFHKLVSELRDMKVTLDDILLITKLVEALPHSSCYDSFRQAWLSVAQPDQTMENFFQRLKQLDTSRISRQAKHDKHNRAFVTEQQQHWKNNPNYKPNPNHKKNGTNKNNFTKKPFKDNNMKGRCHVCGEYGHFKVDCKKQSNKPETNSKVNNYSYMTNEDTCDKQIWISDGGASMHQCCQREWFSIYEKFDEPLKIYGASLNSFDAIGVGTVDVIALMGTGAKSYWRKIKISNVYHTPTSVNLFSENVIVSKDFKIEKSKSKSLFLDVNREIHFTADLDPKTNLFVMNFKPFKRINFVTIPDADLIHKRIGHFNMEYIKTSILKGAVEGLTLPKSLAIQCEPCMEGKMRRLPYKRIE